MIILFGINIEYIKLAISFLTLASIIFAYLNYRHNSNKQQEDTNKARDRELLKQSINFLKWAHDSLTNNNADIPPLADRLNWLTSARHIQRFKKLKNEIVTDTYKTILDGHEEYWRHKFYLALDNNALNSSTYYKDKIDRTWPENIEIRSALVIVDFSNWDESIDDPIDYIDPEYYINHRNGTKGMAGRALRRYIEELDSKRSM